MSHDTEPLQAPPAALDPAASAPFTRDSVHDRLGNITHEQKGDNQELVLILDDSSSSSEEEEEDALSVGDGDAESAVISDKEEREPTETTAHTLAEIDSTQTEVLAENERKLESEEQTVKDVRSLHEESAEASKFDHSYTIAGSQSSSKCTAGSKDVVNDDNSASSAVSDSCSESAGEEGAVSAASHSQVAPVSSGRTLSATEDPAVPGASVGGEVEPSTTTSVLHDADPVASRQQSGSEDEGGKKRSPTRPCTLCGEEDVTLTPSRRSSRLTSKKGRAVTPAPQSTQAQVKMLLAGMSMMARHQSYSMSYSIVVVVVVVQIVCLWS